MVRRLLNSIFFLFFLTFFVSCETDEIEELGWKPEVLGPIGNTTLDFYDFEDLLFASSTYEVGALDLQIPDFEFNTPIPVPPLGPIDLPPEYLSISDFFESITVDSALISITIKNIFPLPIGETTKIVARDSASGELLFQHAITQDIAPGEEYEVPLYLRDATVSSTMEFSVEDFVSPGGDDLTVTGNTLEVEVDIEFVVIQEVVVKNDINYEVAVDTVDFDLSFEEIKDTAAYSGYLSIFFDSYFPTSMVMSLVLLDENDVPVYNFFDQEPSDVLVIPAAPVDAQGNATDKSEVDLINYIDIDEDIALIEKGKKMVVSGVVITAPTPDQFIITEESEIGILITGRIKVDPTKVE